MANDSSTWWCLSSLCCAAKLMLDSYLPREYSFHLAAMVSQVPTLGTDFKVVVCHIARPEKTGKDEYRCDATLAVQCLPRRPSSRSIPGSARRNLFGRGRSYIFPEGRMLGRNTSKSLHLSYGSSYGIHRRCRGRSMPSCQLTCQACASLGTYLRSDRTEQLYVG